MNSSLNKKTSHICNAETEIPLLVQKNYRL